MDDELMAGRMCPKCDETIWRDGTCGCTENDIDEENMKLYQKLVADDLRVEADLIKQGELAAKLDMLLEECWYNLNGYQYMNRKEKQ